MKATSKCAAHILTPRFVCLMVGLTAVQATPALAQQYEVRLRQGYDGNVYEVNADLTTPVAAQYSRLDVAYESPTRRSGMSLVFRPQAHVEWYPQTSSGNKIAGSLSLGLQNAWRGKKSGGWRRKTTLGVDASGAYVRALFLKRSTREELRIGAVDPSIPLQDLPSRFEGGAQATLRKRATSGLTLAGSAFGRVREYVDSNNPSVPRYSKLDLREFGGGLEVYGNVAREWTLSGTAMLRDRVYPNRSARTLAGDLVPGELRKFLYLDAGARADFNNPIVHATLRAIFTRRADRFEGYYSYYEWAAGPRLRLRLTRTLDARLRYAYGERNYDVYAPTGSPMVNNYHDARAAVALNPAPLWSIVVGVQYERSISNDPIFNYDRFQVIGEVQIVR